MKSLFVKILFLIAFLSIGSAGLSSMTLAQDAEPTLEPTAEPSPEPTQPSFYSCMVTVAEDGATVYTTPTSFAMPMFTLTPDLEVEAFLQSAGMEGVDSTVPSAPDGLWWLVYAPQGVVGWVASAEVYLAEDCVNVRALEVISEVYSVR
jgi:hypothetical protein